MEHRCIKPTCSAIYKDESPDDDYCPVCREKTKKIATEIDKKMANRPHKPISSDLSRYEELKNRQGVSYGGITAVPAKDFFQ